MSRLTSLTNKQIKQFLFCLCILLSLPLYAAPYTPALERALQLAGKNRASLEHVLKHYATDKEKYQAACYLIENMPGYMLATKVDYYDSQIDVFRRQIDSTFYTLVKGKTGDLTNSIEFKNQLKATEKSYRDRIEGYPFRQPVITKVHLPDIQAVDGQFLIRQIDNAHAGAVL